MSVLREAVNRTIEFISSNSKEERKKYGQFFTSESIAIFMVSLFSVNLHKKSLNLLDAGAGSGILSIALYCRLRETGYKGHIKLICYETDDKVLDVLIKNLSSIEDKKFSFEIRGENYITSQEYKNDTSNKKTNEKENYDLIIGNPPYKKIAKNTPEATHMKEVCYGAPNLYFLFWAMGIYNLKDGGEIVYIVPRSWTSGAYFESFRKYMLSKTVITDIHIFERRDKVFDKESVLQETMIIKVVKRRKIPEKIKITSSDTSDFSDIKYFCVDYDTIVPQNGYVYLVTNHDEAKTLATLNRLANTLPSNNLQMKTGLVVDFRSKELLRSNVSETTYPLFYSQHIKKGRVLFPIGKENEYIETERKGYLQENSNYVFIKRFTAKEEKRRLQCGVYLSKEHPDFKYISTQNKINYIKCHSEEEAYGLYVILNSSIYDQYYRILNGSTQVNSTEINRIPMPSTEIICKMGKEIRERELTQFECDKVIAKWIK